LTQAASSWSPSVSGRAWRTGIGSRSASKRSRLPAPFTEAVNPLTLSLGTIFSRTRYHLPACRIARPSPAWRVFEPRTAAPRSSNARSASAGIGPLAERPTRFQLSSDLVADGTWTVRIVPPCPRIRESRIADSGRPGQTERRTARTMGRTSSHDSEPVV
jgi:hypothetical protein